MEVIASHKRQKCLHMTTFSDSELLAAGSTSSRVLPTAHPVIPFRRDQEEGACIMQLDLVVSAYKTSTEPDYPRNDGELNEEVIQDRDFQEDTKEKDQTLIKKKTFEYMQKSYTELSQLLALAQSLHGETYMTLATCTRPGGLQAVGTSVPTMQHVTIIKKNLTSFLPTLRETAKTVNFLSQQRQSFVKHLQLLMKHWKVVVPGGKRGRRALTGRDVLALDAGLGFKTSLSMLESYVVAVNMDSTGGVVLTPGEVHRTFQTLTMELSTPLGLTCVSVNTHQIFSRTWTTLGDAGPALEGVHLHCQRSQQELMDKAMLTCLRIDASLRADRWIVAPPLPARDDHVSLAAVVPDFDRLLVHNGLRAAVNQNNERIQQNPVCAADVEIDVQVVHRSEVVVRLSDHLLLRISLQPVPADVHDLASEQKQPRYSAIQQRCRTMLSKALLHMQAALLRSSALSTETEAEHKSTAVDTSVRSATSSTVAGPNPGPTEDALSDVLTPRLLRELVSDVRAFLMQMN